MPESAIGLVVTTVGTEEHGEQLARLLVERRLAACVNVLAGVRSIYRWQGQVHDEREHVVLAKICVEQFDTVRAALRKHHPYDTPEILLVDVADGDPEYLRWVLDETRSADPA